MDAQTRGLAIFAEALISLSFFKKSSLELPKLWPRFIEKGSPFPIFPNRPALRGRLSGTR
jgi:hypothetical protein